ncbi:hypothetical protein [Nisaea nitritireducens]|uniref:hypothetical protein n=1 Tax=Nisaea nitritireducens TaxID=568392 RepID=UPI0018690E79|nr:hypothetical protein [Nisaea nitritireducens]
MQQTAQAVQGVIIGRPTSDAEFAGTTYVAADLARNVPLPERDTAVTWPRFDDGSSCAVEFRELPVEAEGGKVVSRRIAVPVRSATVGRRGEAYQASVQPERFIPETVEALALPNVWTRGDVLNWLAHGLVVIQALPSSHIYPAGAQAQALPIVREATESYGWAEARPRWTPDITDIAMMEITLGWTGRLRNERHRKALLMFCSGMSSAAIARALNYSYRGYGKVLAMEAADLLAIALNEERGSAS